MFIQARLFWSLAIAFVVAASPAQAFRACTSVSNTAPSGHWPDPRNTAHFGTQKWDFDWRVDQEGLEVSNVRYTSDLSHPKKLELAACKGYVQALALAQSTDIKWASRQRPNNRKPSPSSLNAALSVERAWSCCSSRRCESTLRSL